MKIYKLSTVFLLFTQVILALQQGEEPVYAAVTNQQPIFELTEDLREPKNIMFSAMMGGSSHVLWVLSIVQELVERGHNATFYTRDDQVQFGKRFPSIHTVSIGPSPHPLGNRTDKLLNNVRNTSIVESVTELFKKTTKRYQEDYIGIQEILSSRDIDLSICDHLNIACIEAANKLHSPLVISSSMPQGPDSSAPYINNDLINIHNPTIKSMSFFERLNDVVVRPLLFRLKVWLYIRRENLELQPTFNSKSRWIEAVKIVNTAFGFEQVGPIGPMTEFVGPVMPTKYPGLNTSLEHFLNRHKRVAYIAFGQHVIFTEHDVVLIMKGLLEAYEANEIDGFIWAIRGGEDRFPRYLVSSSNTTYDIHSFLQQTRSEKEMSDIYFIDWAPQIAILAHPSTSVFITHGGAGSLYESFYAGVRVVVYPFFGDQPRAAITSEKNGVGLYLKYESTPQEAARIIRAVARDENKFFQNNVNRFKMLVQIKSKHSAQRAADIVEEVLYMHLDGKVPHRWDVRRELPFVKANNLDIFVFLMAIVVGIIYGFVEFVSYLNANQRIKL